MTARIGFIYFGAYPDIRVVKMTDTLAKAGFEVIVLSRHIKGVNEPGAAHPYAHLLEQRGEEWRSRLKIRRLLDHTPEKWRAPLTVPYHINPIWRRAIRDLVVRDGCQLLIVRDMPLVLAATAVGKRYGVPVIFDMAENYPAVMAEWRKHEGFVNFFKNSLARNVTLARLVEKLSILRSSAVLVVVEEQRERVRRVCPSQRGVFIVGNTPDLETVNAIAATSELLNISWTLVMSYFGVLHPFRSLDTVFASLKVLPSDVGFLVIGGGKFEHLVKHQCRSIGVEDRVLFTGWRDHSSGLSLCERYSHVGVIPHARNEHIDHTIPNKLYDYMAIGQPVIVSDAPPAKRIVNEVGCGLVFRSQDAEDLAEKVLMLRDPELRAQMGANGRKAVEERYNWGVDGARLVEVVEQMLRRA